ncbi:MAG: hypothetical protein UX38_C0005G0009 [Microgenomates group bacterium GW2011_GWC1_46_16]|nr:MAG: hypothetical protein UX38_C0005G0009 [Microgenomates group bacterium GW2011_GWC1_46_16]KKU27730.1 MAG: hypothetical protein UX40_C0007G0012 [Microgenomates group bacterium GW2011_GWF2_46_18]KKU43020.1 MAG: hypothetical protein UX59_C0032G0008 [Microgenomates group bacterium GW2011_GWA1_46_7]KKU45152.1 MAG: hypothetical protein UX63_C0011G0024 [Microgenomates group bacterium GW2011_GWB1_46_7]KKU60126.1 MAG: hypothetical protein UX82_C0019G0004 [Microgenomates group bacterium GW2011_GWE1_
MLYTCGMNNTVTCPNCGTQFSPDALLTHSIELELRTKLEQELSTKVQEKTRQELADRDAQIKELKDKARESAEFELKLRAEKRAIEEAKEKFELEKTRQLDLERSKIKAEAFQLVQEQEKFKLEEKEKMISDLKKSLDEAQRKANQGSQQTQGEVLELEIEDLLRRTFPTDEIIAIAKGVNGADIRQLVRGRSGALAGTIIWETKRTKNWTESWVQKLKNDQRTEKAEIAVLVSTVLPKAVRTFGVYQGIWVSDMTSVIGLAMALRTSLLQVAVVKQSSVGKNEKMEVLYNYLSGVEFKQRIEAIVESFTAMKLDLEKEKLAYTRIWAKRDKQIDQVVHNTIGLHSDLEGLMGKALPKIDTLELEASNS